MTDDTVRARIVWIDRRSRLDGDALCEVIYEVDTEPDLLKQMEVPKASLYDGATRGDEIEVVGGARIVPVGRQRPIAKEEREK